MSEVTKDTFNGYVAFVDLLGFSELVKRRDFLDSFANYSGIIENAFKTTDNSMQYIIFSDSLVVNTVKDDKEQLITLLKALSEVNYHLLVDLDLPVCGCISTGSFSRAETSGNVMIAGTPIVEAVHYEQLQDWIGIMLAPSVMNKNPDLRNLTYILDVDHLDVARNLPWPFLVMRYEEIPTSTGNYDGLVSIPKSRGAISINSIDHDIRAYIDKIDQLKLLAPDTGAQRKYNNTNRFCWGVLNHIADAPNEIRRDFDVINHPFKSL